MRSAATLLVLAAITTTAAPAGQARPDFSGTWVASDQVPDGMERAPSPVFGPRFALDQRGDRLTLRRPFRDEMVEIPFVLDGSRTRYPLPGRMCEGDAEYVETATWDGADIVVTLVATVPPGGGREFEQRIRRVIRRGADDTVVVETAITRAGAPVRVATVYTRASEPLPASPGPAVAGVPARIAQIGWLPGFWTGTTKTLALEERWTPIASGSTIGLGRALRGDRLASFEFLCIAEKRGTLVYTAMPDGRTPPTHFTLTAITGDSATFENPAHDFPQLIRYTRLPDGSLETMIAATGGARAQSTVLARGK